jgi:two-component system, OmpR family, phosphate regulon response regulator PhoB
MEQKKVLVVEDNRALLELIGKFLQISGWEASLAHGTRECWERLKEFHPRVILLDMLLSEGSGFELAQSFKKMPLYRNIPILAMTGLYARHEIKKCLLAGCDDVLLKPFRFAVLDKTLTGLVDRAEPAKEVKTIGGGSPEFPAPSGHLLH